MAGANGLMAAAVGWGDGVVNVSEYTGIANQKVLRNGVGEGIGYGGVDDEGGKDPSSRQDSGCRELDEWIV